MRQWKYFFLSLRFKPLILGLGPVFVGLCLSFSGGDPWCLYFFDGCFFWVCFLWSLSALDVQRIPNPFVLNGAAFFCVLCIQSATHFFNDAWDFVKGADSDFRKGPRRAVQKALISPSQALKAGAVLLFLAAVSGLYLVWQGGWPVFLVGVLSLALAYCYTGGPFPLSYTGLADLFVPMFFGLIPVSFVFYLNTGGWSPDSFPAGLSFGLLALSLLALNNLRDEKEDRPAGKKTLVVRWGKKWGALEWTASHFSPYVLGAWWFFEKPFVGILPFALFPFSLYIRRLLLKALKNPSFYGKVFSLTLRHYSFFLILFCAGLVCS